jgi:hypothetical protein
MGKRHTRFVDVRLAGASQITRRRHFRPPDTTVLDRAPIRCSRQDGRAPCTLASREQLSAGRLESCLVWMGGARLEQATSCLKARAVCCGLQPSVTQAARRAIVRAQVLPAAAIRRFRSASRKGAVPAAAVRVPAGGASCRMRAALPHSAYVPFRGGSRTWIGMRFGLLEPGRERTIGQSRRFRHGAGCWWSSASAGQIPSAGGMSSQNSSKSLSA